MFIAIGSKLPAEARTRVAGVARLDYPILEDFKKPPWLRQDVDVYRSHLLLVAVAVGWKLQSLPIGPMVVPFYGSYLES